MAQLSNETRRETRKPVNVEVEYRGPKKPLKAITGNLSLGGMFVATKKPLKISDKVFFRLKAGPKELHFNIEGEVVWNNGRGCQTNRRDFPTGMGVKFINSRIVSKKAIKGFVGFIEESSFRLCT